jgi:hypothetical protein
MLVSLLLESGRDLSNPLRWKAFCLDKTALSLQFGKITLHFTNRGANLLFGWAVRSRFSNASSDCPWLAFA